MFDCFFNLGRLRIAIWSLCLDERVEHSGPLTLEVAFPLESALQQSLDSLLRFRPRQRGLKGVQGVEEPVGGWQRDLVNDFFAAVIARRLLGGDAARERIDEAVPFRVWKCPVDVSVSFRGVAVEVVRAENDFRARPRPTRCGRRSVPPPPGCGFFLLQILQSGYETNNPIEPVLLIVETQKVKWCPRRDSNARPSA